MAGAMRKMGIYLGLVEDDQGHDEVEYDDYHEYEQEPAPPARREQASVRPWLDDRPEEPAVIEPEPGYEAAGVPPRITTLHPRTYNEARVIGENFRDGIPVIMNLSEMADSDAKRLVDFAAGLIFSVHGSIERVTSKVFLLTPPNVMVAAEDKQRLAEGGFFNQS